MTNKEILSKWFGKVFAIKGIGDVCILVDTAHFGAPEWYVNSINKHTPAITIEIKCDGEFDYKTISYNELARAVEVDEKLSTKDSFDDLTEGTRFQIKDSLGRVCELVVITKYLDEVFCYYANCGNARVGNTTILSINYINSNDNFKILEI